MRFERLALVALLLLGAGCGGTFRPFGRVEVFWEDPDRESFSPEPAFRSAPHAWNEVDQMVFRRFARMWRFDPGRESINVNAVDEVPSSSWYTRRLGHFDPSRNDLLEGPCRGVPEPVPPYSVRQLASDNGTDVLHIADARGRVYEFQLDALRQPERASAAEVIGSRVYHAAGYFVPCTRIVHFTAEELVLAEDAHGVEDGIDTVLGFEQLEQALGRAHHRDDGFYRAAARAPLPGRRLGPWRYEGLRDGDYNDVVPHEDRRDVRAGYVLASWLNHYDASERTTQTVWISDDPRSSTGHLQHVHARFTDCLGAMPSDLELARRVGGGHAGFFDLDQIATDFLTLGAISRPWHTNRLGLVGATLGYWNVRDFEPQDWRPGYPNPAFQRATPRDFAWMARILAHLTPDDMGAIIAEAQVEDPLVRTEIERILVGRWRRLLDHWLRVVSPLAEPQVVVSEHGHELCAENLLVRTGLSDPARQAYWRRGHAFDGRALSAFELGPLVRRAPAHICVGLPDPLPSYLVVELAAAETRAELTRPLWVHLIDGEVRGVERPYDPEPPGH